MSCLIYSHIFNSESIILLIVITTQVVPFPLISPLYLIGEKSPLPYPLFHPFHSLLFNTSLFPVSPVETASPFEQSLLSRLCNHSLTRLTPLIHSSYSAFYPIFLSHYEYCNTSYIFRLSLSCVYFSVSLGRFHCY